MYTWVANTLQRTADGNFFNHVAFARDRNIGAIACSTDVNNTLYEDSAHPLIASTRYEMPASDIVS
ncbi:MAG: hypothetical protein IPF79_05775 [Ignavibacteria bacterium]|nr:hypothetical protein [Ignavibacteria bacterium]